MDLNDLRIPANRHGYVYLITLTRPTDGRVRYYVGQHLAKTIDRNYLGSGVILNKIYKKYGKKGHKSVLMWAYSQDELNFYEQLCIHTAKLEYGEDCVNLCYGGADGRKSKATRKKMSDSLTGRKLSAEHRLALRETCLSRSPAEKALIRARLLTTWKNKSESEKAEFAACSMQRATLMWITKSESDIEKTRARMSFTKQNKSVEEKALTSARMSISGKGRVWSLKSRQSLSDSRKQTQRVECPHCGTLAQPHLIYRYHFDNCKQS